MATKTMTTKTTMTRASVLAELQQAKRSILIFEIAAALLALACCALAAASCIAHI